ncbi:unnamed protein product [Dracunculus medinensis]|uniref:Formyl_trans_N domain-containing protein n=1 Tax=Dracunculus medinensis TaxID=318479 RepID=A0A0N4UGD1_DRAME|nr:unnamed protein product [Dracunculus medinensis]
MTDSIVATTFDFKIDDQKTLQIDDQRMQEGFIVQLAMSHKSLHKDKNQEAIDSGRIIAQRSVEILENDDEENLHNRIKKVEHVLYPEIMHRLARNFCKSKSPAAFR